MNTLESSFRIALDVLKARQDALVEEHYTGYGGFDAYRSHSYNGWPEEAKTEYEELLTARRIMGTQASEREEMKAGYNVEGGGMHDDWVESHPSYAVVGITHPQGGHGKLFGCKVSHTNTVSMTISTATRHRSLARDWISSGNTLIEVSMSYEQWARVISSSGREPCPVTITSLHGEHLEPPEQMSNHKIHADEFERELGSIKRLIEEHLPEVVTRLQASGTITKAERTELAGKVSQFIQRFGSGSGFQFLSEQYIKFLEEADNELKTDAEAWLQRLAEEQQVVQKLEDGKNGNSGY